MRGEAVPWTPPPPVPATLDAQAAQDEGQIVRHLEAHPDRLNVDTMGNPELVRASVELLLRADRAFLAERLLAQAVEKWPEDAGLRRAWGRVLLSLGRPEPARAQLEKVVVAVPSDPSAHYLLAKAWLAREPRTPESDARAAAALREVVRLDPDYQDPDGVTAAVIRDLLKRLPAE